MMLAVITIPFLVRVEDEEEAAHIAIQMEIGARERSQAEVKQLVTKAGRDLDEELEKLEKLMAFLGPQVMILPEVVVNA